MLMVVDATSVVRRAAIWWTVGLVCVVSACSASSSGAGHGDPIEAAAPRRVTSVFLHAVGAGDADRACSLVEGADGRPLTQGTSGWISCRAMVSGHTADGASVDDHRVTRRLTVRPVLIAAGGHHGPRGTPNAGGQPPAPAGLRAAFGRLVCHGAGRPATHTPDPQEPIIACSRGGARKYLLGPAELTGTGVANVAVVRGRPQVDPLGSTSTSADPTSPAGPSATADHATSGDDIELELNTLGRNLFDRATSAASKRHGRDQRRLAYTLDNQVVSAPVVQEVNPSGRTRLQVRLPRPAATALARDLRSAHSMSSVGDQGRATYAQAGVREMDLRDPHHAEAYLDVPAPLLSTDPGITPPGILQLVEVDGRWLVTGLTAEWAVALRPAR